MAIFLQESYPPSFPPPSPHAAHVLSTLTSGNPPEFYFGGAYLFTKTTDCTAKMHTHTSTLFTKPMPSQHRAHPTLLFAVHERRSDHTHQPRGG